MKSDAQKINALAIMFKDYRIGIINRLAGDRYLFSFEQAYIDDPERPILSLSFKGQAGGLITSTHLFNSSLPPFFSNLLPEGHLRRYLAERARVKPEREFFLLAELGADLPGALTIVPLEFDGQMDELHHARKQDDRHNEAVMRFSLAGIQLKFSALMEPSGGLTVPADGQGGSWILKLPSARFPAVPENEFVMLALAGAIGISLPKNRLLDIREVHDMPEDAVHMEGRALAIERFDRSSNGQRIHMEDFAQVFGLFPHDKYDKRSHANIAAVLWAEIGEAGVFEFVRRLVFSVLIGNADMHLKNWSVLYPDTRTPILSPAYDFIATLPYTHDDKLALNFGGSRSLSEITPDQMRRFADTARLPLSPLPQLVMETVERTVASWRTLAEKELLSNDMKMSIDKQIQIVAANTQRLFEFRTSK